MGNIWKEGAGEEAAKGGSEGAGGGGAESVAPRWWKKAQ